MDGIIGRDNMPGVGVSMVGNGVVMVWCDRYCGAHCGVVRVLFTARGRMSSRGG